MHATRPSANHHTCRLPFVIREFVSCASGGAGERVSAEGVLIARGQQFRDGADQLHFGVMLHTQLLLRETGGEGTTPTSEVSVERLTCA